MDVLVVRHAIAEARDAHRWPDDALRPLTADGISRFRQAADGLGGVVRPVGLVLASPYVRAWQTAEILERIAAWPPAERCAPLEAERPPADALAALQDRRGHSSVAVVGHEPGLSRLISLMLTGDPDRARLELKKGAVARVTFADRPVAGGGVLRWSLTPSMLRALRAN